MSLYNELELFFHRAFSICLQFDLIKSYPIVKNMEYIPNFNVADIIVYFIE